MDNSPITIRDGDGKAPSPEIINIYIYIHAQGIHPFALEAIH